MTGPPSPPAASPSSSTPSSSAASATQLDRLRIDRSPHAGARRRRTPWGLIWTVAVVLAIVAAIAFSMREQLAAPRVRTAKVRRITATEGAVRTTASGYVVARTRAAISSRLSGRLEKLNVDLGSRVRAGELLGELGHADLDAALAQAEADIEVRRRNVATAQAQRNAAAAGVGASKARVAELEAGVREMEARLADTDRVVAMQERLASSGAGVRDALDSARTQRAVMFEQLGRSRAATASARADVDRVEADVEAAGAAVAAAEAGLAVAAAAADQARAIRQDAFILAPFAGVVVRKEAEVGEMVAPVSAAGTTTRGAIVTLVDFTTLEMEVDVIERDVSKIDDGAPCRVVLDARRDHPYAGVVRQRVPTADRATSTVRVKVAFLALDDFVLPEMGGRVEFLANDKASVALGRDRVIVPAEAFTERDGASGVFAVRDGRVEWTPARRAEGAAAAGEVEVAEGLAGGEDVVLAPGADLASGALVKVAAPAK